MTTLTRVNLGLPDIAGWFKNIRKEMKRRSDIKATISQLSALSDYELMDMGIHRGEIYDIAHSSVKNAEENKNLRGWV
jgi:uncharacterized protein YjiS (DUF1127 family)